MIHSSRTDGVCVEPTTTRVRHLTRAGLGNGTVPTRESAVYQKYRISFSGKKNSARFFPGQASGIDAMGFASWLVSRTVTAVVKVEVFRNTGPLRFDPRWVF